MSYVKTDGGTNVVTWPYSVAQLRADSNVSFSATPPTEVLEAFNVFEVHPTDRPSFNTITQDVVEVTPVLVNDMWTQQWAIVNASAKQVAARQKQAAQEAEHHTASLDAWIVSYLAMTPAEAEQYVLDNVTNLATAKSIMSKLAYAVRVLIRKEFDR